MSTARFVPYDGSQGDDDDAAAGIRLERNDGTGTMISVNFLWGWENGSLTQGWGYRHIKAEHGWSPEDRAATSEALATAPIPSDGRLRYIGPEYPGLDGTPCWRVVVVAPSAVLDGPSGEKVMEPTAKGIVTSFGSSDPP